MEETRSFGYICPACGKANFHTRSVFALSAAAARMECECGKEALEGSVPLSFSTRRAKFSMARRTSCS